MTRAAGPGPIRVAHVSAVDLTQRFLLLGQLLRLREEGYDVTAISAPGPWVTDLEARGIRFVPWRSMTRSWDPRSDARAFFELLRILRRERFDIVHLHTVKAGLLGRVAARLAGVPFVVDTVHGLYATPDDPWRKRFPVLALEWFAALFSDLELYQSEEDLDWARRIRLVDSRKARLLGNGTDLGQFAPEAVAPERKAALRAEFGIAPESLVVGTVGRLVAEKGYRELFAAAADVRARMPDVRFLVAGQKEPTKWDAISDEEIARAEGDVIFAGWRQDVRDLLAIMDVFVLPSWREGLPRSAVEAAGMGKPLVVTDIRGCREVVRDGVEGMLVPVRDPGKLAEVIVRLLDDPALRDRMGAAARARAIERFDERRVLDAILHSYRMLLGRRDMADATAEPIRVRAARSSDVPALARLHRQIPYAFLEQLGDAFLRRLYRALVSDPDALVLLADAGGSPVGFVATVPSTSAFYRRFAFRHGILAGIASAPRLIRPNVLRKLLETARYPGESEAPGLPEAELLSIAVAPAWLGRGVGATLVRETIRRMGERDEPQMKVVVRQENKTGNDFYARMGFEHAATVTIHDGKPSNVWVITCPSSSLLPSASS